MSEDEKAIRSVIARWHDATAAGDVDSILELMAEDAVFLVPGNEPMRGRQAFANALRPLLKTQRIESRGVVQEVVVSGNLAYSWTQLSVSMTARAGGEAIVRKGSTLSIFRKQLNGSWVLARDANMLTAPNQTSRS